MLIYMVLGWLVTIIIGCAIVGTSDSKKIRKSNCRKLLKKYKMLDENYNKSLF